MIPSRLMSRLYSTTRRPLTSKHGNKDYYKGKGSGSMGRHTRHGQFIIQPEKTREFIIPDLSKCQLKAYVSSTTPKVNSPPLTRNDFFQPGLNDGAAIAPPPFLAQLTLDEPSPSFIRLLENIEKHLDKNARK